MFGSWVVGVFLRFSTNGAATMSRLSLATQAANAQLLRQQGYIDANTAAMMRYERQMERVRVAQFNLGTKVSGALALGGFAGMAYAVTKAADLQRVLIGIQNVTGASRAQMANFYNDAFRLGNQFGMSPVQAAEIMRTTARMSAGQMTASQMRSAMPTVAEFAMLMQQNRGMSLSKASEVGISIAHLFRAYDPKHLESLIDKTLRLSEMMGEGPESAMRQMAYYMPLFKSLGVDDTSSLGMMALLSRAGFRNKVGTNVRAFLLQTLGPLQLTQHAQAGKNAMLEQMGITSASGNLLPRFTRGGHYDMFGVLYQIANWEEQQKKSGKSLADIDKILYGTFGKQGGTIAALFADPQMTRFLGTVRQYLNNPKTSMAEQAARTQTGLGFQFGRAVHNLEAVFTELGYPWLGSLTSFFKGLGDHLHGFQVWLHHNRGAEKEIGEAVAALTALFGIRFAYGSIVAISRLSGLIFGLGKDAPMLARFGGLVSNIFGISIGRAGVSALTKFGFALRGIPGELTAAATGLELLGGALTGLAGLLGAGSVFAFLYGAHVNATRFPNQKFDRGSDLNRGITNPADFPTQVDVFGRVIRGGHYKPRWFSPSQMLGPGGGPRQPSTVHLKIDKMSLVMPKGTTHQQASALLQHLARLGGSMRTFPTLPRALTVVPG